MGRDGPSAGADSCWFGRAARSPLARAILFCLPFSGGGASTYFGWSRLFPPEIEVCPVHLPGREDRLREPADATAATIADALAGRIDRPYALYGHSMGARLGFEVLRALSGMGVTAPLRFYPAACPPPDVPDTFAACVTLPDDAFIEALIQQIDAPAQLRDSPELREFSLPLLRQDLLWCYRYRYVPGAPLLARVVALAGESDAIAAPGAMAGWARYGLAFEAVTLPGGHFFLRTAERQLTGFLAADLLAALDAPTPPDWAAGAGAA